MMKYVLRNYEYVIWNDVRYLGKFHKINGKWYFTAPAVRQPLTTQELIQLGLDLNTLNVMGEI